MEYFENVEPLPRVSSRNGTKRSRACNDLIERVLDSGAATAKLTPRAFGGLGFDSMYRGLWSASCNAAYHGSVAVRKAGGAIYLVRRK